jgi:hypothetical protein
MKSVVRAAAVLSAAVAIALPAQTAPAWAGAPAEPRSGPYKPQDWARLATLPDLNGVWETLGGPISPRGAPLTPKAAAYLKDYQEKRDKDVIQDIASANCVPPGVPINMAMPYPIEILIGPSQTTVVMEAFTQVRHFYTDGRPLPEDPDPAYNGHSIGRWEKDALVVETIGLSPDAELAWGLPHSDKAKIVERYRLASPDKLEVTFSITDPEMLTAPWTFTRSYQRRRGWILREYVCSQNNRHELTSEGKAIVNLQGGK